MRAIDLLLEHDREVTLDALGDVMSPTDRSLLATLSHYDPKLFKKLAQDLQTLGVTYERLFDGHGERLDVELHPDPPRTRLVGDAERAGRRGRRCGRACAGGGRRGTL